MLKLALGATHSPVQWVQHQELKLSGPCPAENKNSWNLSFIPIIRLHCVVFRRGNSLCRFLMYTIQNRPVYIISYLQP